jgi:hypothetical protein
MKKLALNRETLISLGDAHVAAIDGAAATVFPICAPFTRVVALCYYTKVLPHCIPVPGTRPQ